MEPNKSMSLINNTGTTINAYTTSLNPQLFLSTVYCLTGKDLYVEYKAPVYYTSNYYITQFVTNFGDGSNLVYSNPTDKIHQTYKTKGTYHVSYSAIYSDNTIQSFVSPVPFIVKNSWDVYNQENIRLINEINLMMPYTLDQIYIQPNEWGVEDIFNTAITRLQDNLDYLKSNTQTMNTESPSEYFGWLGSPSHSKAAGISWSTQTYNSEYINNPELAVSDGKSYFSDIRDAKENSNGIYVLDGTRFRAFSSSAIPQETIFTNANDIQDLLIAPQSFDIDSTGQYIFIADTGANKIYKFNIDLSSLYSPSINIQLYTGGFGLLNDHDKFNSPTEVNYANENVYVVDYNNNCVKQYNQDLNWIYTYFSDSYKGEQIISVAVHPITSLVYILTLSKNIYVYDNRAANPFVNFSIKDIVTTNPIKISFDENGDFFYVLTSQNVYKYSSSNTFITNVQIPKTSSTIYNSIRSSVSRSLLISSNSCLLKFQDVLDIFKIGGGLSYEYWSSDQLKVTSEEFSSDLNYNRSLIRIAQNIKTFRDTLNAQFILATEQTTNGTIQYFSFLPIDVANAPVLNNDVENETLGVGVNELHIPSVFNKELKKLYDSLEVLNQFLAVQNVNIDSRNNNSDCDGQFCWSWKATSSYNVSLPVIRTCGINPITYLELTSDFPNAGYAPNITWGKAISKCCS